MNITKNCKIMKKILIYLKNVEIHALIVVKVAMLDAKYVVAVSNYFIENILYILYRNLLKYIIFR